MSRYEIRFDSDQSDLAYHFSDQDLLTDSLLVNGSDLSVVEGGQVKTVSVDVAVAAAEFGWREVIFAAAIAVDDEELEVRTESLYYRYVVNEIKSQALLF